MSKKNSDVAEIVVGDGRVMKCVPGLTVTRLPSIGASQQEGFNDGATVRCIPVEERMTVSAESSSQQYPTDRVTTGTARRRAVMPGEGRRAAWR